MKDTKSPGLFAGLISILKRVSVGKYQTVLYHKGSASHSLWIGGVVTMVFALFILIAAVFTFVDIFYTVRDQIRMLNDSFGCNSVSAALFYKNYTDGKDLIVGTFEFSNSNFGSCLVSFDQLIIKNDTVLDMLGIEIGQDHSLESHLFIKIANLKSSDTVQRSVQSYYVADSLGIDSLTEMTQNVVRGTAYNEVFKIINFSNDDSILPYPFNSLETLAPRLQLTSSYDNKKRFQDILADQLIFSFKFHKTTDNIFRSPTSFLTGLAKIGGLLGLFKFLSFLTQLNKTQFEKDVMKGQYKKESTSDINRSILTTSENFQSLLQTNGFEGKKREYREVFTFENFAKLLKDNEMIKRENSENKETISIMAEQYKQLQLQVAALVEDKNGKGKPLLKKDQ
ncbi:hypothetical protein FGO68_gene9679 [Halteria grandinella]|uniref:Uncharacterized protein n=1 Tax=Halteria grandinella TaxID=5974 RepID=A0A8J8NNI7_HALGN|nr:hypothetical protein FGO68_gene9679 [Halteria grandinella]